MGSQELGKQRAFWKWISDACWKAVLENTGAENSDQHCLSGLLSVWTLNSSPQQASYRA